MRPSLEWWPARWVPGDRRRNAGLGAAPPASSRRGGAAAAMLPPRIVRRLVLVPLVLVLTGAVIVTLPLLLVVAVLASPLMPGRWRALRLLVFALVWLALESATLAACLGLWVASGFGGRLRLDAYQERHYAVMRWFLATVYAVATRAFRLTVEIDEPELTPEEADRKSVV